MTTTNELPPRREVTQSRVKPSTNASKNIGEAIAQVTNNPERADEYQVLFQETGSKGEWDTLEQAYINAEHSSLKQNIVKRTMSRAEELGLDPVTELKGGDIVSDEVAKASKKAIAVTGNPLGKALEDRIQAKVVQSAWHDNPEDARAARDEIEADIVRDPKEEREEFKEFAARLYVEAAEDGLEAGGIAETVGGFGFTMLPFQDTVMWADLLVQSGLEPSDGTWYAPDWAPGEAKQALREGFSKLSFEQKKEFLRAGVEFIQAQPYGYADFASQVFISEMTSEELLKGNPDDSFGRFMDNWFGLLEATGAGYVVKNVMRAFGPPLLGSSATVIKATANIDKVESQRQLTALLENPQEAMEFGISPEQVARTQLPGHRDYEKIVEDLPEVLDQDKERVAELSNIIGEVRDRARISQLKPVDKKSALVREQENIVESWGGKVRPGMSRISLLEDGSGARYSVMLGKNDKVGFKSQRTAFEQIEELIKMGIDPTEIRMYTSDGSTLKKYFSGKEALEELKGIREGTQTSRRGTFYVEYDTDYLYRPTDKALFGDDPVTAPVWMGKLGRWLTAPSGHFSKEVTDPFFENLLGESTITAALEKMVAPVFKMGRPTRRNIDSMYEFTEDFARREGRSPKQADYLEAFPEATPEEFRGLYLTKQYYETIYDINNDRLYRDWKGLGVKTLRNKVDGGMIHGTPLTREALSNRYDGKGGLHVYNPRTQEVEVLSTEKVDALYARGANILETPMEIKVDGKKRVTNVLNDAETNSEWGLTPLSPYPLKYVDGYYPRMYEDSHYIEKVVAGSTLNGVNKAERQVIAVSSTREEADAFVRNMNDKGDSGVEYSVKADPRLSAKDKTALDREHMQTEGRLFFDDRNDQQLYNINGSKADILSPVNAIQRTARTVSRQVRSEDLVKSMKTAFKERYANLFEGVSFDSLHSSQVSARLKDLTKTGDNESRIQAQKAWDLWDYIGVMEGNTNGEWNHFRRLALAAGEQVGYRLNKIVPGSGNWLARNGHNLKPLENMRSLAFFDYITTRPFRQVLLQGSQHLFISALDPLYMGKWQSDSFFLLQGMKKKGLQQMGGKKLTQSMMKRNAKLMGLSDAEYNLLIKEFDKSGITQTINKHSYAGDRAPIWETPKTRWGDVAQTAARTATAAPIRQTLQKGFDLGEQYNMSASYMMALRLHKKKKGYKKLTELGEEDWVEVQNRATNLGLAMHGANTSKYQYGILSIPTQFLQFTHKIALTLLGQNKNFTKGEVAKLWAGQLVLFGSAGLGIKPEVESLMAEYELEKYIGTDMVDIIAGGVIDFTVDNTLQKLFDDPDLDFAVGELLAPGANAINVMRWFAELAFDPPIESLAGASGATLGRMYESYEQAKIIVEHGELSLETMTQALDKVAQGALSGYNDFAKARFAYNTGKFIAANGEAHALEVTLAEAWAKGMFGLNSENVNNAYRIAKQTYEDDSQLRDTIREYYDRVNRITVEYAGGRETKEGYLKRIIAEKVLLTTMLDEDEWQQGMVIWRELENAARVDRKAVSDMIVDRIYDGKSITAFMMQEWINQGGDPEDYPKVEKLWKEQLLQSPALRDRYEGLLDDEIKFMENKE